MPRLVASLLLALLLPLSAACLDSPTPLAQMRERQLRLNGQGGDVGGHLNLGLFAEDCPLLGPDARASVNGVAMQLDPGHHGHGPGAGPCYQPNATLIPDRSLGSTLTFEISDPSDSLQMVVEHYQPISSKLGGLSLTSASSGDTVQIFWTPAPDRPDVATLGYSYGGWGVWEVNGSVGEVISFAIPPQAEPGAGYLRACVGYSEKPAIASCQGARCVLGDDALETSTYESFPLNIE